MKTREELMAMRDKLRDRLAQETYRIGNAHHDAQLDKVARVLAGIRAIDTVLDHDLDPPEFDPKAVFP